MRKIDLEKNHSRKSVQAVFDAWAEDYHADGMEQGHLQSVREAFGMIPESEGAYLEIGFGNGYGIEAMASRQYRNGSCYGLDISAKMAEKAASRLLEFRNVRLYTCDFLDWKSPENIRYSCIFSMEVFYYFRDLQKALDKAASLLAPGGLLMVLVNYYQENKATHDWPESLGTEMILWSAKQYEQGFRKSGLDSVRQVMLANGDGLGTLCTTGTRSRV